MESKKYDAMRVIPLETKFDLKDEKITEFGEEIDRYLGEAYIKGAVAVDVAWVADERQPAPTTVTWFDEPGDPEEEVDGFVNHVVRYDLSMVDEDEFLDVLERSKHDLEDLR